MLKNLKQRGIFFRLGKCFPLCCDDHGTVFWRDSGYLIPLASEQLAEQLLCCLPVLDYQHSCAHLPVNHTSGLLPSSSVCVWVMWEKMSPGSSSSFPPSHLVNHFEQGGRSQVVSPDRYELHWREKWHCRSTRVFLRSDDSPGPIFGFCPVAKVQGDHLRYPGITWKSPLGGGDEVWQVARKGWWVRETGTNTLFFFWMVCWVSSSLNIVVFMFEGWHMCVLSCLIPARPVSHLFRLRAVGRLQPELISEGGWSWHQALFCVYKHQTHDSNSWK